MTILCCIFILQGALPTSQYPLCYQSILMTRTDWTTLRPSVCVMTTSLWQSWETRSSMNIGKRRDALDNLVQVILDTRMSRYAFCTILAVSGNTGGSVITCVLKITMKYNSWNFSGLWFKAIIVLNSGNMYISTCIEFGDICFSKCMELWLQILYVWNFKNIIISQCTHGIVKIYIKVGEGWLIIFTICNTHYSLPLSYAETLFLIWIIVDSKHWIFPDDLREWWLVGGWKPRSFGEN